MQFKPKPINLFKKCRRLHTYTILLTVLIDSLTGLKCENWIKVKYTKLITRKLTDDHLSTATVRPKLVMMY